MITGDTVDAVEVLALSACVPSSAAEKFIGSHQHKRWRQRRKLHATHTIVAYMHTCCVIMVLELQAFTDADVMMTSWQARMAEVNDVKKYSTLKSYKHYANSCVPDSVSTGELLVSECKTIHLRYVFNRSELWIFDLFQPFCRHDYRLPFFLWLSSCMIMIRTS